MLTDKQEKTNKFRVHSYVLSSVPSLSRSLAPTRSQSAEKYPLPSLLPVSSSNTRLGSFNYLPFER